VPRAKRSRPWFDPPDQIERAILDHLAHGRTHAQIASELHYHEGAVGHILVDLARRWRVSTRQLLILAGTMGWAMVPDRQDKLPLPRMTPCTGDYPPLCRV